MNDIKSPNGAYWARYVLVSIFKNKLELVHQTMIFGQCLACQIQIFYL